MEENERITGKFTAKKENRLLWRLHEERTEEALWDCVVAFQEFEFHTYSGLPYSYHMKYGRSGTYTKELWIDRREKSKSLVWSSVRSCVSESAGTAAGECKTSCRAPEGAGRYPRNHVYLRHLLRVCPAGNAGEGKRETRHADGGTKNAGKIKFQPMQDLTTTKWVV